MAKQAPFRHGLGVAARDPGLTLAEIAWRWTFGAGATAILAVGAVSFLESLHVSDADLFALRTGAPILVADAVAHIFQGAGPRLLLILAAVLPGVSALWILAASVGRAVTLHALLGRIGRPDFRPLLGLSLLRAGLGLATLLAWFGALILAGLAATRGEENSPGVFLLVFLLLALLVATASSVANWYLALAPLVAVRDGCDTFAAVSGAVDLVRRKGRDFASLGFAFGSLKLFALGAATVLSLAPLALAGVAPGWLIALLMLAVALAYFAFANFLYMARFAAYARIAEDEEAPAAAAQPAAAAEPLTAVLPGEPSSE